MSDNRIVAVGLLTRRDLDLLGPTFNRVWEVDDTQCFSQLLQAIDEADLKLIRDPDPGAGEDKGRKRPSDGSAS